MVERDQSGRTDDSDSIAVVGMNLRVPGARTLEEFWENLRGGVESTTFFSDEQLLAAGVPAADLDNPDYVKAFGALEGIDLFDAEFFGFTPREAEALDPQHRIFLECAWRALEHAGCDPERYDGRIAVFGGVGLNGYLIHNLLGHQELFETLGGFQLALGNDKDFAPTRVSYKLNLQGPSISVNTACSTSLVATVLGCQSLLSYQCDMVLAGGCSVHLPQDHGYWYHPGGTLSSDGHCRPFDGDGDGTIDGNGAALVALKRLEDALADGDAVHGLIRGFAINNDGNLKVGYTAPSVEGQAEVIREAQEMAGVSAASIGYVETHGTGTDLGDPVEIAALTEAFCATADGTGYCAIGSVKSNIGHLDTAAGTASLIKTLLALKYGQIPPTLHFRRPNPKIDFVASPFYVNTRLSDWPRQGDLPRRAGVSSFGIGGTNAHVIVEEAPAVAASGPAHAWQLLPLSARTQDALDEMTSGLADHLRDHPEQPVADVAHTLQVGRREFRHRRIVLARDRDEAIQGLRDRAAARVYAGEAFPSPPVVFLFPGQDVQHLNMAAELRLQERVFCAALEECAAILSRRNIDLDELVWPASGDSSPRFDADFAVDPVPLFAIEYALARLWQSWGVEPSAMLGYSLGEYVAATLAEVVGLDDALTLAAAGRELLAASEPGAMLAVSLGEDELEAELGEDVYVAMVNGPRQCVAGGRPAAVEALRRELDGRGITCQPIQISRAFHTPLMESFAADFRQALAGVDFKPPAVPYVSCLTGDWIRDEEATDPEHYLALATSTVRLSQGLESLFRAEVCHQAGATLLEVAPEQTLGSLAIQHPARPEALKILSTLYDPRYLKNGASAALCADQPALLSSLGRLWIRGLELDWHKFAGAAPPRRRLPLPGYPLQRQRYWVEPVDTSAGVLLANEKQSGKIAAVERWFYLPGWRRLPREQQGEASAASRWLIFLDESGLGDALAERLEAQGSTVVLVYHGIAFATRGADFVLDTTSPEQLDRLLAELVADGRRPERVVHMSTLGLEAADEALLECGFYSLLYLGRALGRHCFSEKLDLDLVGDGIIAGGCAPALSPAMAAALGPIKVIPQEYPNIRCRAIDIESEPEGWRRERLLDELGAELDLPDAERTVVLRGAGRWVERFDPLPLKEPAGLPRRLRQEGVYLITGGLGNIGLTLADYLHREARARLVLASRSPLPPQAEWRRVADDPAVEERTRERLRRLLELREAGAEILVAAIDAADPAQMETLFAAAEERFGAVHGVIHAAGLVGQDSFATIRDCEREACERQFRPKVLGLVALEQVLAQRSPDFCLLCSSLSPILGGLGFNAYAATNLYLDAAAQHHNCNSPTPWLSINWEGWHFDDEKALEGAGAGIAELGLLPDEGCAAFARIMDAPGLDRIVVSTGDLQQRLNQWVSAVRAEEEKGGSAAHVAFHARPELLGAPVAPGTPTEEKLVGLWRQLLGIGEIGALDNFFELGGNSLLLTQLVAQMRRTFQVDLSLAELFGTPTVSDIAAQIDRQQSGDENREVGEI